VRRALFAIILLLASCGGGDAEPNERATTQPVDCKAHPERCR